MSKPIFDKLIQSKGEKIHYWKNPTRDFPLNWQQDQSVTPQCPELINDTVLEKSELDKEYKIVIKEYRSNLSTTYSHVQFTNTAQRTKSKSSTKYHNQI
jgi:hypothetical protein